LPLLASKLTKKMHKTQLEANNISTEYDDRF
jgi:hypothetical protein